MQTVLYGSIGWKHPFGIYQVLQWARQFGWDCVDLRGMTLDLPGGPQKQLLAFGYDMLGPRQIRPSARPQIRDVCREMGIPIVCLYCPSPVNLDGTYGREGRELFCEFLQLAADLEVEWVRSINNTTQSYGDADFTPEEAFERTVEGLQEVGAVAADLGVGILLENNENTVTSSSVELLQMQNALDDVCRVGIAFDGTNAYFQGFNPFDELQALEGCVDVMHLKNVKRHNDPNFSYMPRGEYSYQWTSLAEGDIDWKAMLKLARDGGFDGPLTFEYVNPFKGMPADYWNILREPEEAAREEADYLRQLLREIE